MSGDPSRGERVGWGVTMMIVAGLTIPWFLWGEDTVVAGLPIWVWWHACWMAVASIAFHAFARRAWGMGVVRAPGSETDGGDSA